MRRKQVLTFTLPLCICIVISATWLAHAGDLTPPDGPVTSSMVTLDEIANLITGTSQCSACTWDYYYTQEVPDPSTPQLIASGSGVVHAMILTVIHQTEFVTTVKLGDGVDGADLVSTIAVGYVVADTNINLPRHVTIPLDVRFENGLYLDNLNALGDSAHITILYKSD